MEMMFNVSYKFNKPINLNTKKVTNMKFMFNNAYKFNCLLNLIQIMLLICRYVQWSTWV
nr:BspA family leucine-rich repeat surface protein [Mycoplasmopsis bovis]